MKQMGLVSELFSPKSFYLTFAQWLNFSHFKKYSLVKQGEIATHALHLYLGLMEEKLRQTSTGILLQWKEAAH